MGQPENDVISPVQKSSMSIQTETTVRWVSGAFNGAMFSSYCALGEGSFGPGLRLSTFMLIPKHLRELGGRDKDLAVCDKLLISPAKRSHSNHTVKARLSEPCIWIVHHHTEYLSIVMVENTWSRRASCWSAELGLGVLGYIRNESFRKYILGHG